MNHSQLFKDLLKIQAVDFQRKNILLPDYLQKEFDEMPEEEKLETEIKLIEAEYDLDKINQQQINRR